ncbi:MAG: excinuclease ABC subunit UvrA, partial [Clostridia bacterium]|nr:excinuclease ABC subunit UvrA [Clostridia bacterium]
MPKFIKIRGARVNNLKNVDVDIPRDKFVVLTGLSGSGKSSLAFDTLYAEGHRRFVESLSSYARQFLGQLDKPDLDSIEGLSPAISIDQKTTSKNPRSTVGTVTEIYDYLRLLYARIGIPHCPICGKEIRQQTTDQIIDRIMELPEGERFMVLAPVVRGKKGRHEKVFEKAKRSGYSRVRVDGIIYDLAENIEIEKNNKHDVDVVIDRLVIKEGIESRLTDSVETAIRESEGAVVIATMPREGDGEDIRFSTSYACEEHGVSIGELEPRMFSFNNPFGACPKCAGLGVMQRISVARIIPDRSKSLLDGAIAVNGFKSLGPESWSGPVFEAVGEYAGFTMDEPIEKFSEGALHALLHGTGERVYDISRGFDGYVREQKVKFEGILNIITNRMNTNSVFYDSEYYSQFFEELPCPECGGSRLNKEASCVTVG